MEIVWLFLLAGSLVGIVQECRLVYKLGQWDGFDKGYQQGILDCKRALEEK